MVHLSTKTLCNVFARCIFAIHTDKRIWLCAQTFYRTILLYFYTPQIEVLRFPPFSLNTTRILFISIQDSSVPVSSILRKRILIAFPVHGLSFLYVFHRAKQSFVGCFFVSFSPPEKSERKAQSDCGVVVVVRQRWRSGCRKFCVQRIQHSEVDASRMSFSGCGWRRWERQKNPVKHPFRRFILSTLVHSFEHKEGFVVEVCAITILSYPSCLKSTTVLVSFRGKESMGNCVKL